MRENLVMADPDSDPSWIGFGRLQKLRFEFRFARAHYRKLHALANKPRQRLKQKIQAFLRGEAAHHANQQRASLLVQAQLAPQEDLVGRPSFQMRRIEIPRKHGVFCRVPHHRVEAVQDSAHMRGPRPEQAVKAHAVFSPHDLRGIGWRDGGDPVGKL